MNDVTADLLKPLSKRINVIILEEHLGFPANYKKHMNMYGTRKQILIASAAYPSRQPVIGDISKICLQFSTVGSIHARYAMKQYLK